MKKGIFVHSPWVPNCMQNLKGGWKFSFPKMFDSYRDLFLDPFVSNLTHSNLVFVDRGEVEVHKNATKEDVKNKSL